MAGSKRFLIAACLAFCAAAGVAAEGEVCRLETDDVAGLWRAIAPPPGTAERFAALPPAVIAPERLAAFVAAWDLATRLAERASRLAAAAYVDDAGRYSVVAGFRIGDEGEGVLLAWETALLLAHPGAAIERRGARAMLWRLPGAEAGVAAARAGEWLWLANDAALIDPPPDGRAAELSGGGVVHMERLLEPLLAIPGSVPGDVARDYGGVSYATLDAGGVARLAKTAAAAIAGFPERFAAASEAARSRSLAALREAWLAAQFAYTEHGAYAAVASEPDAATAWFTRSGAPQRIVPAPGVVADDGPEALLLYEGEAWRDGGRRLIAQDGATAAVDEGSFEEMLRRGGAIRE